MHRGIEYLTSFFTSTTNANANAKRAFSHLYAAQDKMVSIFASSNEINLLLLISSVVLLLQVTFQLDSFYAAPPSINFKLRICV